MNQYPLISEAFGLNLGATSSSSSNSLSNLYKYNMDPKNGQVRTCCELHDEKNHHKSGDCAYGRHTCCLGHKQRYNCKGNSFTFVKQGEDWVQKNCSSSSRNISRSNTNNFISSLLGSSNQSSSQLSMFSLNDLCIDSPRRNNTPMRTTYNNNNTVNHNPKDLKIERLEDRISQLEKKNNEKDNTILKLEDKIIRLEDKNDALHEKHEEFNKNKNKIEAFINDILNKNEKFEKELKEKNKKIFDLNADCQEKDSELQDIKKKTYDENKGLADHLLQALDKMTEEVVDENHQKYQKNQEKNKGKEKTSSSSLIPDDFSGLFLN
jgi:hypothetical protein